jgi:hypothetical protein
MTESYFRIPKHYNVKNTLEYIAIVMEGNKGGLEHTENFSYSVRLAESSHGYKYQIGIGNDSKIGITNEEDNIYCIVNRYMPQESLNTICKSICIVKHTQYIYNLEFEGRLRKELYNLYENQEEYYSLTRDGIKTLLNYENLNDESLSNIVIQDKVISAIRKTIKKRRKIKK